MSLTPHAARNMLGNLDVKPSKYPFAALLVIASNLCTGTILGKHWVLTAARCHHNDWESRSHLLAGDVRYRLGDEVLRAGVQRRPLFHLLVHPEYWGGVAHDVMLVGVKEALVFSERCHHLQLTDMIVVADNTTLDCEMTGFGVRGRKGSVSLQTSLQKVTNLTQCRTGTPEERQVALCTDSPKESSESAACSAGSGAPLVCRPGVLTAVTHYSRHLHCDQAARLNVYLFVGVFRPWLESVVPDLATAAWSRATGSSCPRRLLLLAFLAAAANAVPPAYGRRGRGQTLFSAV